MTRADSNNVMQLTPIQMAWLQELGIDKRLLSHRGARVQEPHMPELAAAPAPAPALQPVPVPIRQLLPATMPIVADSLPTLALQAAQCQRCDLHNERGRVAFGQGVTPARWLVVGEAPDSRDDREGKPFSGKAGQLLTAMLSAVGIQRDTQVYMTHLVKCRPLGNRPPTNHHIQQCAAFLQQQIAFVQPNGILALGDIAGRALSGVNDDIEQLRGRAWVYRSPDGLSLPLFITYHPAALLLQPQLKALAWRDLLAANAGLAA